MDLFRKLQTIQLDGLGEIFLKRPSGRLVIRLGVIQSQEDLPQQERWGKILAEVIADCWVDKDGKRKLESPDAALEEMDFQAFLALGNKIVEVFRASLIPDIGEREKNSEAAPAESLPVV